MDFTTAVRTCLNKFITFSGRARRSEFWWFWLFCALVALAASVLDGVLLGYPMTGDGPIAIIVTLAIFLPSLAVSVRRLHDTGRSGWWMLLLLLPLIGAIVLLVWYCQKSEAGTNRFGEDPMGRSVTFPDAV